MRTAYPFQFGTVFLEWEDDMLTGLSFKEEGADPKVAPI